MKVFIGFDDTDFLGAAIGTGRLARMCEDKLPSAVRLWGVLCHQLLVDDRIPYTSHNCPACAVVEIDDARLIPRLVELAIAHLTELASPGSDPGLCVARADGDLTRLVAFGVACTNSVRTQEEARSVALSSGIHLSGHGGIHQGIIGAAAAVGLSAHGWSGRFLEFGRLRALPDPIRADQLIARGMLPVILDGDASVLPPDALIHTQGWLSPRLWAGRPVVPVQFENGRWLSIDHQPHDAEMAD